MAGRTLRTREASTQRQSTPEHKEQRLTFATDFMDKFGKNGYPFNVVTCDEPWVHYYQLECKEHSKQWLVRIYVSSAWHKPTTLVIQPDEMHATARTSLVLKCLAQANHKAVCRSQWWAMLAH